MQSRMNNTGYFVAVDGPNGSGKTTVINAIAEKLGLMGILKIGLLADLSVSSIAA